MGGGRGGARVSDFFHKESKSKKNGGGALVFGWGDRVGGLLMDEQSNRPKPICPFNLFEVGDITMH